jgi:phenylacetyl-CoA:acceptor oxidoreductase subunit 2
MTATAGIIAAVSGWWLKFTIVTRAAFNQGFALPTTPVRGAGSTHPGARPGW